MASNLNPTIASVNITSSTATISALTLGNTTISICQTGGQCASLYINVSGTTAQLALSQSSLSLTAGQNTTVSITGGGGYYVSSNSLPSVATAQISGNSAIVSGVLDSTRNTSSS